MGLTVGDKIPLFILKDQYGNDFDVDTQMGNKALVVYFYPKDFTPGCTAQACSFRDHYEAFTDVGIIVIGISSDNVAKHEKFAEKYRLPFILLSDTDRKVSKLFGVKDYLFGLIPGRETFVFDKEGILQMRFNSIKASDHIKEVLKTINSNS